MTAENKMKLTESRQGRIIIHLISYIKDHHLAWHLQGIIRELRSI